MKVRCTWYLDSSNQFTVGKAYAWKNNTLVDDNGYCYKKLVEGTDIKQWKLSYWYDFEKVKENNNMSDKEIYDILKNKMDKNGIVGFYFDFPGLFMYDENEMMKAVALAYTVGYKRIQKGRSFKYGDKK